MAYLLLLLQAEPLLEASEESQIEAAIQASIREAAKSQSQQLKFESDSDSGDEGDNSDAELETFTGSSADESEAEDDKKQVKF